MKVVALQRMHFGSSLLRVRRAVGVFHYYRFLFARLQPRVVVAFLRVELVGPAEVVPISPLSGMAWKVMYKLNVGDFVFSDLEERPAEGGCACHARHPLLARRAIGFGLQVAGFEVEVG